MCIYSDFMYEMCHSRIWQTNKNSIYLAVINKRTRLKGA